MVFRVVAEVSKASDMQRPSKWMKAIAASDVANSKMIVGQPLLAKSGSCLLGACRVGREPQ